MSSAILYLAIVAIWACVLIPRWLRRDSARGASAPVAAKPPVVAELEESEIRRRRGTIRRRKRAGPLRRTRRRSPVHGSQSR